MVAKVLEATQDWGCTAMQPGSCWPHPGRTSACRRRL